MLKPICSFLGCPYAPVAQVIFANGGGSARYCKGHLTVIRARSIITRNPKSKIDQEVKL